ncbi:MAG: hypothetical protein HYW90_04770 [Candidatus Sungbacteria bacterium]|nr:hypothetical protein [Candidatus Sungbacteria bacterium]
MITPFLIIGIRILIPFAIPRWPFWGMLLAVAADASDVMIFDKFGWGILGGRDIYHEFDKVLDIYYLAFAAYAALRWQDVLLRRTAFALFAWRLAGVIIFEITHARQIFFFAPNIFENFYLIVSGFNQFFPAVRINNLGRFGLILLIAAIPKIIQEYIMHYLEFPIWAFLKNYFLFWLY